MSSVAFPIRVALLSYDTAMMSCILGLQELFERANITERTNDHASCFYTSVIVDGKQEAVVADRWDARDFVRER